LVQEDKRSAYRRRTVLLDETLPDPNSSRFSEEVETAASARAILDRVPEDLLPVIRSLYGLSGEEPMTARQVASTLGIQEEALRQRLFRLRSKLRRELRENT
jgi:DNA-directed RNA polymerase specialized sigma24 family protein